MAIKLYDLARMTVSGTPGTGTITLGSAVAPFLTFANAGVQNGDTVSYSIVDGTSNSEVGRGTYNSSGPTLTRGALVSTNSNAAISATSAAQVTITALAEDIAGAGLWKNTRLAKTANYPVDNADKGVTFALGGTAYFTLTFSAASGYDADFVVFINNEDTARAKKVVISGGTTFLVWPGQTAMVYAQNNVWKVDRPNRWMLTAAQDIYVDTTSGLDDGTNDGMSSSSAFLTVQHAYAVVQQQWDLGGAFDVRCNMVAATTTLTAGITLYGPLVGSQNPGRPSFRIIGAGPVSTLVTSSTASLILFYLQGGAQVSIEAMKLKSSGSGAMCVVVGMGWANVDNIWLDAAGAAHLDVAGPQSLITGGSNGITILTTGSTNISVVAEDHGQIQLGCPINISGTPAFATAFAQADLGGFIDFSGATVVKGSATGKCAQAITNGIVFFPGGTTTSLPGNVAATASQGGLYLTA